MLRGVRAGQSARVPHSVAMADRAVPLPQSLATSNGRRWSAGVPHDLGAHRTVVHPSPQRHHA